MYLDEIIQMPENIAVKYAQRLLSSFEKFLHTCIRLYLGEE